MSEVLSPKYPNINIPLIGHDGNAFSILGRVVLAMRRAGLSYEEWEEFHSEATAGDYNALVMTVMRWFTVDDPRNDGKSEEEWYAENPYGCYDCREINAQGGCPFCGL